MPNITIEYTRNLPAINLQAMLSDCNRTLAESGQFAELDIKSHAHRVEDFVIGTAAEPRAFVFATLALLSGRAPNIKRDLSQRLLSVLQAHFPPVPGLVIQIAVELRDMDRESFSKIAVGP